MKAAEFETETAPRIGQSAPIAHHEHCGRYDQHGFITGKGCHSWHREYSQKYQGDFFNDNLHGRGIYVINAYNKRFVYDGYFYANSLEGYAQVIYKNAEVFEGLFKDNRPFGPGVRTNLNGTQDVGLWEGNRLVRLSCKVHSEWVPQLAESSQAKAKLLKYRKLVPVCSETIDVAKEALRAKNADEELLRRSHELYNPHIKHKDSTFFNRKVYDKLFFGETDCTIDVTVPKEEQEEWNFDYNREKELDDEDEVVINVISDLDEDDACSCYDPIELRDRELKEEVVRLEKEMDNVKEQIEVMTNQMENLRSVLQETDCDEDEINAELLRIESSISACRKKIEGTNFLTWVLRKLMDKCNQNREASEGSVHTKLKKVVVSDLLAWNNGKLASEILKQCFKHRKRENEVSFSVNKLLAGDRGAFNKNGTYENACIEFLMSCSNGNKHHAMTLLYENDLHPDLSDVLGNTGIIYGTARDKLYILKYLVEVGANINVFNDDGLTPLTLAISRYLAVKNNITNWEAAFLCSTPLNSEEQRLVDEWHPQLSFVNLLSSRISARDLASAMNLVSTHDFSLSKSQENVLSQTQLIKTSTAASESYNFQKPYINDYNQTQTFLLSTELIKPFKNEAKKGDKLEKRERTNKQEVTKATEENIVPPKRTVSLSLRSSVISSGQSDIVIFSNKLDIIERTIRALLDLGANPNVGEVPMPPLILSLFTENSEMVSLLLKHQANPNVTTLDENMTALHVLSSLPLNNEHLKSLRLLLEHGADPNLKTNSHHWVEEKAEIIGNYGEAIADEGKTPLHIISMRYDYDTDEDNRLLQMAEMLLEYKANPNEEYLGHVPLTLALLRGNKALMKRLLKCKKVDPNRKLGAEMGVPLTVPVLKRYKGVLSPAKAKEVTEILIEAGANPFIDVGDVGNVIDFMENETKILKKNKSKVGMKKSKKSSGTKPTASTAKSTKVTQTNNNILKNAAKDVLTKQIQNHATRYIYKIFQNNQPETELIKNVAKLITLQEASANLQILLDHNKIKPKKFNTEAASNMLHYINTVSPPIKQAKKSKMKSSENLIQPRPSELLEGLLVRSLPKANRKKADLLPAIDKDISKYKVCYHCLKRVGRKLLLCPGCKLVYFCSRECNKASIKMKDGRHRCGIMFYGNPKYPQIGPEDEGGLMDEMMMKKGKGGDESEEEEGKVDELGKSGVNFGVDEKGKKRGEVEGEGGVDGKGKKSKKGSEKSSDSRGKKGERGSEDSSDSGGKKGKRKGSKKSFDSGGEKGKKSSEKSSDSHGKKGKKTSEKSSDTHGKKSKKTSEKSSDSHRKKTKKTSEKSSESRSKSSKGQGKQFQKGHKDVAGGLDATKKGGKSECKQKRLPHKYRYFIEQVIKIFPEFDFPNLLLPYACFSGGQLYYRFYELCSIFCSTYSAI